MFKLFYVFLFITLAGCISQTKPVPPGILPKEKMVEYLIDLQITESKITYLNLPQDTVRKFYSRIQKELLQKHHISDSAYYKSLSYYLYDVNGMEDIYSAVVDSLSLRERLKHIN